MNKIVFLCLVLGFGLAIYWAIWYTDQNYKAIRKRERNPRDTKELKKKLDKNNNSQPLVFFDKKANLKKYPYGNTKSAYSVPCECRAIVIGISGSGKTTYILTQIIQWLHSGRSLVVTDIKPEIWGILQANNILEKFGYHSIVLNPTDPKAQNYNMLMDAESETELSRLINLLIPDESIDARVFSSIARKVFQGVIMMLRHKNPNVSISEAYDYIRSNGRIDNIIDEMLDHEDKRISLLGGEISFSRNNEKLMSSVMSALTTSLEFLSDIQISESQKGDESLADVLEHEKVAVFLQYEQVSREQLGRMYGVLVMHIMNMLQTNAPKREDILLIFDELLNGGKIQGLAEKLNVIRSYKMPTFLFIQTYQGLIDIYGVEKAETFLSTADLKICYRTNDIPTAVMLSKMSGLTRVDVLNKSKSTTVNQKTYSSTSSVDFEPLIKIEDMAKLGESEAVCIYKGECAIVRMPRHYIDTVAKNREVYIRPSECDL